MKKMERNWYLVDAENKILGRLATRVATLLSGKGKTDYEPNVDHGDFVVVINAARVKVTGKKLDEKLYRKYSGYPGGLKEMSLRELLEKKPEKVVEFAVRGMLPKNRLAHRMFLKLKVYPGAEHPHAAQDPSPLEV